VKNHPIKEQPHDSPGTAILSKPPTLEVCYILIIELMVFLYIFLQHVTVVIFSAFIFCVYTQVNFSRAVAALSKAQVKNVKRFLPNPERHWGPKVRAGRKITSKHVSLLGLEAINGVVNGAISHDDGNGAAPDGSALEHEEIKDNDENEPTTKRQKIGDDEPASEP
jgi:tRNA (guanine26-N2/guanine27-N2)-dimethyltransferase